ncbi:cyclin N-terminal domain-containing protein 1 isoform X1 [Anguilla rostrata]|uniref:cyclin N-terminal domain-containing protein 1 isoform X1 n=1 Tax=Anguilla rostrata TaxID=7938 RepID=UPI0030D28F04
MEIKSFKPIYFKDISSSFSGEQPNLKFGEVPFNILYDFLTDLSNRNKHHLNHLSTCSGSFKDRRLVECVFLICEELKLDSLAGYQAIEILERFMIKHLDHLFCTYSSAGDDDSGRSVADYIFIRLSQKFSLLIISCIQLASKLTLHSNVIDNNTAVKFLKSIGLSYSKDTLLESELLVLKTLNFSISVPNPLMYVETLLEVLGYNDASAPVSQLYALCHCLLRCAYLQRKPIYHSLLVSATKCASPSQEQRVKFAEVTEDFMLLSVGVIAAGAFILNVASWEQVTRETGLAQNARHKRSSSLTLLNCRSRCSSCGRRFSFRVRIPALRRNIL